MTIDFKHIQAAHCENGVTTNLLRHIGVNKMTEPLAFGIGSGLFFIHIPLLKINNGPAISYRSLPGWIFTNTCNALNVPVVRKKFSSPEKARQYLDECLKANQPVGCQVGVYYLTYFPKEYRFHFNAHNVVVFGKEDDNYLVSDPVMETATVLNTYELQRVRFAKGALAPRGQLYYPQQNGQVTDEAIRKAIVKGIKRNIIFMLRIPGNVAGIRGIRYTARKICKWRDKLGVQKAGVYLAQLVRMQEEIGTGGGGFRFIYAAFLQQACAFHPSQADKLLKISEQFTKAGDLWRSSAVQAAGIFKGRITSQQDFNDMANYLYEVAEIEKQAFIALSKIKWN